MAKLSKKGIVPQMENASNNMGAGEELKGMNFKVPASFYKEFKVFAAERDMSMTELLKAAFDAYKYQ